MFVVCAVLRAEAAEHVISVLSFACLCFLERTTSVGSWSVSCNKAGSKMPCNVSGYTLLCITLLYITLLGTQSAASGALMQAKTGKVWAVAVLGC